MRVKVNSVYAIGLTEELGSQFENEGVLFVDLEEGAHVEALLRKFPHLGPPESYDDIMIHVFVNGEVKGFDHVLTSGDVVDIHIPVAGG